MSVGKSLRLLDSPLDWRGLIMRAGPHLPLPHCRPDPALPRDSGSLRGVSGYPGALRTLDLKGQSRELHQVPPHGQHLSSHTVEAESI